MAPRTQLPSAAEKRCDQGLLLVGGCVDPHTGGATPLHTAASEAFVTAPVLRRAVVAGLAGSIALTEGPGVATTHLDRAKEVGARSESFVEALSFDGSPTPLSSLWQVEQLEKAMNALGANGKAHGFIKASETKQARERIVRVTCHGSSEKFDTMLQNAIPRYEEGLGEIKRRLKLAYINDFNGVKDETEREILLNSLTDKFVETFQGPDNQDTRRRFKTFLQREAKRLNAQLQTP